LRCSAEHAGEVDPEDAARQLNLFARLGPTLAISHLRRAMAALFHKHGQPARAEPVSTEPAPAERVDAVPADAEPAGAEPAGAVP
ncbi:hypothetical protein NL526_29075, partial [Klebsiella pneumoniae]|nr:hypothetical protein [Klebsiella pneumoniae]